MNGFGALNGVSGVITKSGGDYNFDVFVTGISRGGNGRQYTPVGSGGITKELVGNIGSRIRVEGQHTSGELIGLDSMDGGAEGVFSWKYDSVNQANVRVKVKNLSTSRNRGGRGGSSRSGNDEVSVSATLVTTSAVWEGQSTDGEPTDNSDGNGRIWDGSSYTTANDTRRKYAVESRLTEGIVTNADNLEMLQDMAAATLAGNPTFPGDTTLTSRRVTCTAVEKNAVLTRIFYAPQAYLPFTEEDPDIHLSLGFRTVKRYKDHAGSPAFYKETTVNSGGADEYTIVDPVYRLEPVWTLTYRQDISTSPVTAYNSQAGKVNSGTFLGGGANLVMFVGCEADPTSSGNWTSVFTFKYAPLGWTVDIVPVNRNTGKQITTSYAREEMCEAVSFAGFPTP